MILFVFVALCTLSYAEGETYPRLQIRQGELGGTGEPTSDVATAVSEASSAPSSDDPTSVSPSEPSSAVASPTEEPTTREPAPTRGDTPAATTGPRQPDNPQPTPDRSSPRPDEPDTDEEPQQPDRDGDDREPEDPRETSVSDGEEPDEEDNQPDESSEAEEPQDPETRVDFVTTTAGDEPSRETGGFLTTTIFAMEGSSTVARVVTSSLPSSEPTGTEAPGLNGEEDGGSGSSGLTSSQKNIIIGTVVGIGGAILLGALGVVAWRIWGKKKHNANDDDAYDPNDIRKEASSSGSSASPFKSTLDQYHQPTPVNSASNF